MEKDKKPPAPPAKRQKLLEQCLVCQYVSMSHFRRRSDAVKQLGLLAWQNSGNDECNWREVAVIRSDLIASEYLE